MSWGRIGLGLVICAVGVAIAITASTMVGVVLICIGAFVVPAVGEYAARQQRG
jgi:fucose permease